MSELGGFQVVLFWKEEFLVRSESDLGNIDSRLKIQLECELTLISNLSYVALEDIHVLIFFVIFSKLYSSQ